MSASAAIANCACTLLSAPVFRSRDGGIGLFRNRDQGGIPCCAVWLSTVGHAHPRMEACSIKSNPTRHGLSRAATGLHFTASTTRCSRAAQEGDRRQATVYASGDRDALIVEQIMEQARRRAADCGHLRNDRHAMTCPPLSAPFANPDRRGTVPAASRSALRHLIRARATGCDDAPAHPGRCGACRADRAKAASSGQSP